MKSGLFRAAVVAVMISATPSWGSSLEGVVVAVADGDTLTVLDDALRQHHVRLSGADAPERRQAFGTRARQHLVELVFQRRATVDFKKQDRYGRTVGKVVVDGMDIGLAQISAGMAWHYKSFEREQSKSDRQAYALAERQARSSRLGVWSEDTPQSPWEFRRRAKAH